jgi:hypothetical protein
MNERAFRCPLICALIGVTIALVRGQTTDEELTQRAKEIADYYLQRTSDFEDVEHFGGPFRLEECDIKVRSMIPNEAVELMVTPKKALPGAPHFPLLQIWASIARQRSHRTNNAPPLFGEYKVEGKLSSAEIDFLLKSVAELRVIAPNVHLVTLQSETNFVRQARTLIPIDKIKAISDDEVIVYGGYNIDHEFNDYLPVSRPIQDAPKGKRFPKTLVASTNVSDGDLLEIAKTRAGSDLLHDWSYVRQIGSSVRIEDGKFIRAKPGGAFVFRKEKTEWRFVAAYSVMANSHGPMERFTLLPKPPTAAVRAVIKKDFGVLSNERYQPVVLLLKNGTLKEEEVFTLIELFLRIGRINHEIIDVRWKDGEVTIRSGKPFEGSGDTVTFTRINNIWVIRGVGGWIS